MFAITIAEIGQMPFGRDDYAAVRALVTSIIELVEEVVGAALREHAESEPHVRPDGSMS